MMNNGQPETDDPMNALLAEVHTKATEETNREILNLWNEHIVKGFSASAAVNNAIQNPSSAHPKLLDEFQQSTVVNEPPPDAKYACHTSKRNGKLRARVTEIPPIFNTLPKSSAWTFVSSNVALQEDERFKKSHVPYFDEEDTVNNEEILKSLEVVTAESSNSRDVNEDQILYKTAAHAADRCGGLNEENAAFRKELFDKVTSLSTTCRKDKDSKEKIKTRILQQSRKGGPSALQNLANAEIRASCVNRDTFTTLFCSRCFVYNCLKHSDDDMANFQKEQVMEHEKQQGPCQNDCFKNGIHQIEKREQDFSFKERVLFLRLTDTFSNNYCVISDIMLRKCSEVAIFASSNTQEIEQIREVVRPNVQTRVKVDKATAIRRCKKPPYEIKHYSQYLPCSHEGECSEKNGCDCRKGNTFCDKFCNCSDDCKVRFSGCACKGGCINNCCPCQSAGRECDADLCDTCGARELDAKNSTCKNICIQRFAHKHLLLGVSTIENAGWGIFTKDPIPKGDYIYEYVGERIDNDEGEQRGLVYDKRKHTYLFQLNNESMVDALHKGNKIRFANHSKSANCLVKQKLVYGDHRLGVFAKRDIDAGEELFLDYAKVLKMYNISGQSNKKDNKSGKKNSKNTTKRPKK